MSKRSVVAIGNGAQIGAGPGELIAFRQDNPRPFSIQTQMPFDRLWHFQCGVGIVGLAMRNRNHKNLCFSFNVPCSQDNGARTVFRPLLAPQPMFPQP